eukprot:TRINITY_DN22790_c0_g1_i1.p1 TRINITY_DN22790_c0_g1~~TRINITY_DN22790_c0_g1_i1.p1  ORF type:complete len:169 (-),score=35.88 TRINITY_DN22790_c0_g1_i1:187-693(-)
MAEETILTADDLMKGLPSPVLPVELAPQVLQGVDTCAEKLNLLFRCLQRYSIEPFCQDEIILFRRCSQARDEELRRRLVEAEVQWTAALSEEEAKERQQALQAEATLLDRRFILATSMEGLPGFRHRWQIHGELQDLKKRIEVVEKHVETSGKKKASGTRPAKRWYLF